MVLKEIEIETIFGIAMIKAKIAIRDFRKVNTTLRGLRFCIKINPKVVSGRNKGPVRTQG